MTQVFDCLIIGASAAGLATAACLKDSGQTFEILEASDAVGQAWRHHYDRLHLHTPKSLSSLPGLPMPSEWPRYPDRDQVVDYLVRYRAHHGLEPRFGQKVNRLERRDDNWLATTVDHEWCSRNVVIATGANRQPIRPTWPGLDSFGGQVMHSSGGPTALPGLYFCGQFVSPAGMLRQIRIEAGRIATSIARASPRAKPMPARQTV